MLWLKRLNFMETAKLEMELMKAFEAGEDLDAKLEARRRSPVVVMPKRSGGLRCGRRCC